MVRVVALYIVALLAFPADFGLRVGGVILSPSRIVLLAAVVVALVDWHSRIASLRSVPVPIWVGWVAFLGATLITALIAPSGASWARYGSLVGEGLVVFALVWSAASAPGGLRALFSSFAVTIVAVAAVVLLLGAVGIHYDRLLADLGGTAQLPDTAPRYGFERQAGPFRAPLFFAIWLTAGSALLLPAMARGSGRLRAIAIAAWLIVLVAVVTLTASRLAMTTMFLVPAVYFLVRGQRVAGVTCLVAAVAVAFGVARLIPTTAVIEESSALRLAAINPALQAIGARPLFGWGLLSDSTVLSGIIGKQNFVDDTYLSLAVETGLVGLGAFVALAASVVYETRRGWHSPQPLALAIAVVVVLGMGVFASVFQVTQGYAAFFVLAGLAVVAAVQVRAGDTAQPAAAT